MTMPSESKRQGFFDRFATRASTFVSRGPFFAGCVLMVLVWAPSYFLFGTVDTWQLVINTATTIVTFLMVAVLQNSQARFENATNKKLNAIADALADYIEWTANKESDEDSCSHLQGDAEELREAVGLEHRESA